LAFLIIREYLHMCVLRIVIYLNLIKFRSVITSLLMGRVSVYGLSERLLHYQSNTAPPPIPESCVMIYEIPRGRWDWTSAPGSVVYSPTTNSPVILKLWSGGDAR
jgi:hypothetical protein